MGTVGDGQSRRRGDHGREDPSVKKTVIALSDGRELIYFDASEAADRSSLDQRALERIAHHSELRYNRALDEWIIVAAHRQQRTSQPALPDCPLCPSRPGTLTEIPGPGYEVVVFENRFPAMGAPAAAFEPAEGVRDKDGLVVGRPGVGRCEVVCFTSDHHASFARLPAARAELVLAAWTDRTAHLSALPGVEQVFCFENRGREVGVTLDHPHGQIYAYPFVTPRTAQMVRAAQAYRARTGRNLAEDILAFELQDGSRIVARAPGWTAFVPYAPRWPYEVHIYPTTRVADLTLLSDLARDRLAVTYLDVLRRFDALFGEPLPYISAVHQAPVRKGRDELGLHIELCSPRRAPGKLKYLAATESAMDAYSNEVSPEEAARQLREAWGPSAPG
jgi:UDPglucose--hexose-1-phosphate uridylyltransferase